jgi:hypothetical protein
MQRRQAGFGYSVSRRLLNENNRERGWIFKKKTILYSLVRAWVQCSVHVALFFKTKVGDLSLFRDLLCTNSSAGFYDNKSKISCTTKAKPWLLCSNVWPLHIGSLNERSIAYL